VSVILLRLGRDQHTCDLPPADRYAERSVVRCEEHVGSSRRPCGRRWKCVRLSRQSTTKYWLRRYLPWPRRAR